MARLLQVNDKAEQGIHNHPSNAKNNTDRRQYAFGITVSRAARELGVSETSSTDGQNK